MSVGKALNGYKVPTAIVAVLVSLLGVAVLQSCGQARAVEVETARLKTALDAHLLWSAERNVTLGLVDARTQAMMSEIVLMKARQEEILRLLQREYGR